MALASTAAAVSIQDASGAVTNLANGANGQFTPGTVLTVSLQSTSGIGKWSLAFNCQMYPALHQRVFDWLPGMNNAWAVPMPAGPASSINPLAGIQLISVVSDASGGAVIQSLNTLQSKGANAVPLQHIADYVIVAALPAYTNAAGTLTGTGNAAVTSAMADGATPAVGDIFLLEQGRAASAADVGLYQLVTVGSGSVPFVATRMPDMAQGNVLLPKTTIEVGPRGTVFGTAGTTWVNTLTGLTNLIGTASFTFFPRQVTWTSALVAGVVTGGASATAGAPAVMSVQSATLTQVVCVRRTANTTTATVNGYAYNGNPTAGGLGTGSVSMMACVAAGTVNNADVSTMDVTVINPC
jgi:hypothetical protein